MLTYTYLLFCDTDKKCFIGVKSLMSGKSKWVRHFNLLSNLFTLNQHCHRHYNGLFLCPPLWYYRFAAKVKVAEHSLAVCAYMSFAKSRQGKDCSSQAETWQVKNILMEDFYWQVEFDFLEVSMATRTIECNLKISLLLSLQKNHSLDFSINLHTAYYN